MSVLTSRLGRRPSGDPVRFVWVLFVVSAVCQYLGAGIAVPLFDHTDPAVIAWLRTVTGGIVLVAITRPIWVVRDPRRLLRATMFGLVTTGMNVAFYLAISDIDLGVAVAIEFIGPTAVAAVSTRGPRGVAAIVAVVLGVVLASGASPSGSVFGVSFAVLAGVLWAGYIVLGARVSGATATELGGRRRWRTGVEDLGVGLAVAGLLTAPVVLGVSEITGSIGLSVGVVAAVAAVGVLSSVIPYVLDQVVLTRIGRGRFALMLALLPATAVLVGAVVLAQVPTITELVGIALVIVAITLSAGTDRADEVGSEPAVPG
ncbi:EamA family transporter [Williamsia maris]|uniref:Inner membrane transporter RhtA n=1 Tax=Williamsia maris TaxID=72806 RepID=A0ABT1HKK1_9NOCA|nr:EamA family transporter [Williamsia maris]MCP2178451.1 inner membrane transporter RhtA [Williamsia maris]